MVIFGAPIERACPYLYNTPVTGTVAAGCLY
jgi:hypothetical protein